MDKKEKMGIILITYFRVNNGGNIFVIRGGDQRRELRVMKIFKNGNFSSTKTDSHLKLTMTSP